MHTRHSLAQTCLWPALLSPLWAHAQELSTPTWQPPLVLALSSVLAVVVLAMMVYGVRQCVYALNRMFAVQYTPYADIAQADWPALTVFVAAHNEEKVIASSMNALLKADYPPEKIRIVVVNDRSSDRTASIVDQHVHAWPARIQAFHRSSGKAGKAAALKDAMALARGDIAIIFDADYTPEPGLIKQLVAPFFDPEVGAVMGRVVPRNADRNLLTRLLGMERSAGYQVDQQARMNMHTVPQYGGTVGGVRLSAIEAVGGWRDDVLAEDTDITFRLLVAGWKTAYCNAAACHEEVPEEWSVRLRQVHRWAQGHNQVLLRLVGPLLRSRRVSARERIDGLLLLHIFLMQPLLLIGWLLAIGLYYLDAAHALTWFIAPPILVAHLLVGSFSVFLQMVYGLLIDGERDRIRLLPLQLLNFMGSLPTVSLAWVACLRASLGQQELVWHKTLRYQTQEAA